MRIGRDAGPVSRPARGRYRSFPIKLRLLGVRLSWVDAPLRAACRYADHSQQAWEDHAECSRKPDLRAQIGRMLVQLWRTGQLARARKHEKTKKAPGEEDGWQIVYKGIHELSALVQHRHRAPPLHNQKRDGHGWQFRDKFNKTGEAVEAAWHVRQDKRRVTAAKATTAWAQAAPIAIAHVFNSSRTTSNLALEMSVSRSWSTTRQS